MKILKIIGIILSVLILLPVCFMLLVSLVNIGTDNYFGCKRTIETDKDTYAVGDTIRLTVVVTPEQSKKIIKVYDNFYNLDLSLSSSGNDKFDATFSQKKRDKKEGPHHTYSITPSKPYKHTFYGTISLDSSKQYYQISFPDFGYTCTFSKKEYEKAESIGFGGMWTGVRQPMPSADEEFIDYKPIKISE